jgi:3-oxoacyl-[acyl-carrier protein] reductase
VSARRILVTGASRGIGAALVSRFLEAGDTVFGCGRSAADTTHERYTHFAVDVASEEAVRGMCNTIRTAAGGLDVLINNAGVARMNALALTPPGDARQVVDTNVLGVFNCTHQGIRLLRKSPCAPSST